MADSSWFAELQELGADLLNEQAAEEEEETPEQKAKRFRSAVERQVQEELRKRPPQKEVREYVASLEKARAAYDDYKDMMARARKEREQKQALEKPQPEQSPPLVSDEEDEELRIKEPREIFSDLLEAAFQKKDTIPAAGLEIFKLVALHSTPTQTVVSDWKSVFQSCRQGPSRFVMIYLLNELAKQNPQLPNLESHLRHLLNFICDQPLAPEQKSRIAKFVFRPVPAQPRTSGIYELIGRSQEGVQFLHEWQQQMEEARGRAAT
ncbi:unnamed protein product [Symbiodinium pilosum]|uniref:Uncharacterized protein n=1 Tax=Symbiodinium pilosum TaxID=2952 RepID=A0A812KPH3_SYMPI|nr:unnamed protein product [Symbiodinium pilosum]